MEEVSGSVTESSLFAKPLPEHYWCRQLLANAAGHEIAVIGQCIWSSSGRAYLALPDIGGDQMKAMTHDELFGSPKSFHKAKTRIARAKLTIAAAREQAVEMAKAPPLRTWHPTEPQRRRLKRLRST